MTARGDLDSTVCRKLLIHENGWVREVSIPMEREVMPEACVSLAQEARKLQLDTPPASVGTSNGRKP